MTINDFFSYSNDDGSVRVYEWVELQENINKICKNRSKPDNDARVRPDAKTEFNRTVKRCSTGH